MKRHSFDLNYMFDTIETPEVSEHIANTILELLLTREYDHPIILWLLMNGA